MCSVYAVCIICLQLGANIVEDEEDLVVQEQNISVQLGKHYHHKSPILKYIYKYMKYAIWDLVVVFLTVSCKHLVKPAVVYVPSVSQGNALGLGLGLFLSQYASYVIESPPEWCLLMATQPCYCHRVKKCVMNILINKRVCLTET